MARARRVTVRRIETLADGLTEIMTVSRWDSLESIRGFAGDDIERAVYYPEDDRFLVERDDVVRHYVQRG